MKTLMAIGKCGKLKKVFSPSRFILSTNLDFEQLSMRPFVYGKGMCCVASSNYMEWFIRLEISAYADYVVDHSVFGTGCTWSQAAWTTYVEVTRLLQCIYSTFGLITRDFFQYSYNAALFHDGISQESFGNLPKPNKVIQC